MATFPSYAQVVGDGLSETPDYGVLRTETDGGIAKQRARWSKAIVTRDVQILVKTKENKLAFDEWMRDDLAGGAGWFDFYDCVAGATKQARIVAGKITWSAQDGIWVAACKIETIG